MSDLDRLIEQTLDNEDAELRRALGEEPGFIAGALGTFRGPFGWANTIIMVSQAVCFLTGAWMAWKFYQADTVLDALHWGLPAIVLLIVALVLKMGLMPVMQADRLARDIRRLELRLERMRSETA